MRLSSRIIAPALCTFLAGLPEITLADSLDELAIDLINPVSNLGIIFNDVSYNTFQGSLAGADDNSKWEYAIRPSIPFPLSNGKTITLRARIPVSFGDSSYFVEEQKYPEYPEWRIRQEADDLPDDRYFVTGHAFLDDLGFDLAYGGVNEDGLMTMYGVETVLPTSRDGSIERDQWLLGPEFAIGKITDWGIYGVWASHLTSIYDSHDRDFDYDANITSIKVFFAYGLGNGWQVVSNPVIQYDWEGVGSNKLALPIGVGIAKTAQLGKMRYRLGVEVQKYLASPDAFGPDWLLKFNFAPVIWDRSH